MSKQSSGTGRANRSNWRIAPHSAWAFHHVDQLLPVAPIGNDPANVAPLRRAPHGIGDRLLRQFFLQKIATDAVVVLIDGEIAFEWYANGNAEHTPHILMSATKAVIGLLAGILDAKGDLSLDALASDYVPEIAGTAYRGATIRHLLDMRTGVVLDEGQLRAYEAATNWEAENEGEADFYSFFEGLTAPHRPHGGPFRYVSANTDLLGWVIERATGQTVASLISALLWMPMGAEDGAYATLDRKGLARCTGGLCATARDLARVGQLMVDDGRRDGAQIVPQAVIDDIVGNGDAEAWKTGEWGASFGPISKNMRYRSGWYTVDDEPKTLFAMGIHGQNLFVDKANKIVAVKLSSWKKPIKNVPLWLTHKAFGRLQRSSARQVVR